jgi:hypothetical protein
LMASKASYHSKNQFTPNVITCNMSYFVLWVVVSPHPVSNILGFKQSKKITFLGLLDCVDESTMILQTVSNYLPKDMA